MAHKTPPKKIKRLENWTFFVGKHHQSSILATHFSASIFWVATILSHLQTWFSNSWERKRHIWDHSNFWMFSMFKIKGIKWKVHSETFLWEVLYLPRVLLWSWCSDLSICSYQRQVLIFVLFALGTHFPTFSDVKNSIQWMEEVLHYLGWLTPYK